MTRLGVVCVCDDREDGKVELLRVRLDRLDFADFWLPNGAIKRYANVYIAIPMPVKRYLSSFDSYNKLFRYHSVNSLFGTQNLIKSK